MTVLAGIGGPEASAAAARAGVDLRPAPMTPDDFPEIANSTCSRPTGAQVYVFAERVYWAAVLVRFLPAESHLSLTGCHEDPLQHVRLAVERSLC